MLLQSEVPWDIYALVHIDLYFVLGFQNVNALQFVDILFGKTGVNKIMIQYMIILVPRHEKTEFLPMRKQRRR